METTYNLGFGVKVAAPTRFVQLQCGTFIRGMHGEQTETTVSLRC